MTVLKKMADIAKREMLLRQREISKDLDNPVIGANRFHVKLFQKDFLPYFSGQLPPPKELLRAWANVAGDIRKHVLLINDAEDVVAIVPPLSTSDMIDALRTDRASVADPQTLEARLAAQRSIAPNIADNNLINGLVDRFKPTAPKPNEKLHQQWLDLFKYFGITQTGQTQTTQESTKPELSIGDDY